ncbi:MAG: hypothetical protein ABS36_04695 [Acidobacteria bacterium SCN 69-37]|nr:MAG: hypothetical protein ABS36_04695 [Acidobacteria bacterium SCN 69-37]
MLGTAASAQITTGTVAGTVQDSQGGVIPGATIVLISESRGTRGVPGVTNASGDYVFPNITPDTYTIEVTMPGFRTLRRTNVAVSGGDRVVVPALIIEPGGASETIEVTAEAPLIQAQSGERSFAISTLQIESLPMSGNRNFASLTSLTPGVVGTSRLGGGGQNNIMMDGISAMDTGNNGQMLQMNIESIAEVKVLTSGYQAEYGRSSGLQITAVTKSGTNRFAGSLYDIEDNSDWNTNSWTNQKNGDPKTQSKTRTWGYSIGGPVGRPGGDNKLFFFYSHEYRPSSSGGNINRFRVPTALERAGDFSQTRDNNGNLIPHLIRDASTGLPCSASNTSGCFQDGGVVGRIPQDRLYQVGVNLLHRYPMPNIEQAPGTNYNLEIPRPIDKNLLQQPAVRVDYQLSPALRFTGKYSGQRQKRRVIQGTMPGHNDVLTPYPYITNYGFTVNYTFNPTTFLEGTYGSIKNELAGGGSGGLLTDSTSSLASDPLLAGLPILYPDATVITNTGYYAYKVMQAENPVWWDSAANRMMIPPTFGWGNRIGGAPPNQQFPGYLNINKTQDVAISLTKVAGSHTFKAGFYNNHSYKAQNTGAGGVANLSPFGYINFGNDTNNPIDAGFGYANAALGIFSQYLQQEKFVEGSMIYNNTEFYLQDNWKATNRLTLDYGVRFTHQQPQHDQFGQMSNFFPEQWSAAAAPVLYVPGCINGAATCSGNVRNAMDPISGQFLVIPGVANSSAAIGTIVPNSGNQLNGIRAAGDGISKYSYTWPTIVAAPRFGMAYDLNGTQTVVVRGGVGLFYDRPDGNTIFSIPTSPPITSSQDLRYGNLRNLGSGLSPVGVPAMRTFQYDADVPQSWQWNAGIQMALPWSSSLDLSYVGQKSSERLQVVNLNQVNLGTAYEARYQDPTRAASSVPGATALPTNLLRPLQGLSAIEQNTTDFGERFHSLQASFNRRFRGGLSFGVNYTYSLSFTGNTGLTKRLQHDENGNATVRADQARYEDLMKNLNRQPHVLRGNVVWDLPDLAADGGAKRAIGYIVNDWQLSSIFNLSSGTNYDITYSYQSNGASVNLTGSPDYGARILYVGDPGSGCSNDQYAQFNRNAIAGPTYYSDGLESGRNLMRGCAQRNIDLSLARTIRLGGGRSIQLRMDAFNAFNIVNFTGRQAQAQFVSPTDQTVLRNTQFNADGSLNQNRLKPRNAGFGAVTSASGLRTIRLTARFGF